MLYRFGISVPSKDELESLIWHKDYTKIEPILMLMFNHQLKKFVLNQLIKQFYSGPELDNALIKILLRDSLDLSKLAAQIIRFKLSKPYLIEERKKLQKAMAKYQKRVESMRKLKEYRANMKVLRSPGSLIDKNQMVRLDSLKKQLKNPMRW